MRMGVAAMFLMCALLPTAAQAPRLDEKLFEAAWESKPDAVRILLKKGANPNAKIGSQTVLMAAAAGGNVEVVSLLLSAGASVNDGDQDGVTALMAAALGSSGEPVELLIQRGADVNQKTSSGQTALMMAALVGNVPAVRSLLRAKADSGIEDEDGWTALNWAHVKEEWKNRMLRDRLMEEPGGLQLLQDAGAKDGSVHFAPRELVAAAGNGDVATVRRLIEAGVDVSTTDQDGNTALVASAIGGHPEVARLLLSAGANPNAADNFRPDGLMTVAREQRRVALPYIAEVIETPRGQGRTALMMATRFGHLNVVEILLDSGANVNTKFGGATPLLSASEERNNTEVIRRLLDAGADVNAQDNDRMTALMKASLDGEVETVRLLMARGAKINLRDKDGHTALWWGRRDKAIVALLKAAAAKRRR